MKSATACARAAGTNRCAPLFTHLRAHSSYSFMRGLASPTALVQAAVGEGMDALALTDHHGLTGAIEFYDACQKAGIRPIIGLELEVAPPTNHQTNVAKLPAWMVASVGTLTLLPIDLKGWRSLCRLCSTFDADSTGSPGPSLPEIVPFNRLAQETEGLLCLTGGVRGTLAKLLVHGQKRTALSVVGALKELFADRLYVELQQHRPEDSEFIHNLVELATQTRLPLSATHDIHYIKPDQADLQKVTAAIRVIRPLKDLTTADTAPSGAYFPSQEEMRQKFTAYPQALAGTQEASERCCLELPLGIPHFPEIDLPVGTTVLDVLRQKAEAGAVHRYGHMTPSLRSRVDHEISVIDQCGYAVLFLIVEDILNYARGQGVPTASRGSAASSLVAHCLGITSPDPIHHNLYFERFLNPARATPPDIDTDLCSRRREQVIRYVYARFGERRVATVCTINRFRSRSALREVAKAHGLLPEQVSELADSLPHRWYGPPNRQGEKEPPYKELARRFPGKEHQQIFMDAEALIGLPHHLSVHPGGIVIAPGDLTDITPTQMASKGVRITQFDLDSIERLGLVKIDLLGIRGLTVLGDVADAIVQAGGNPIHGTGADPLGVEIPSTRLRNISFHKQSAGLDLLDSIPEEDPATSETIQQARTIGCFQIESPGMRATLKEIRASGVEDILVALALYRPGPLTGGLKDAFVQRHIASRQEPGVAGEKAQPYEIHPALTPLLADTHGVILYQEQVLRIAHELAGLSLVDADLLRRAMSHFDPGEQMKTLQAKFISGAAARCGLPPNAANQVWKMMAAFAGYGFPKAHAASYAQVGWRSAWCKTHFPALFMAAVLANWGGYYSQRVYLTEARRMGLPLHPPHVDHAKSQFSVKYLAGAPALFMGLDQVKDLTHRSIEAIQREQPFRSLDDFLARVDPRPVEAENLVKISALDGFGSIPALLSKLAGGGWHGGQMSLFPVDLSTGEDWSLEAKVAAQEDILGTGVIAHPLELAAKKIAEAEALTTVDAAARLGKRVLVAGMRQTWRRSLTTRGDAIYFMSLEDLEGMLNVVISSNVYSRSRTAFSTSGPYLIEGMVEFDPEHGEPFIRAERVTPLK